MVVGLIGGLIVVGGLALVPLPGPGWLIVFVGLAVLATEFEWAARLEKFARDQVRAWTHWLGRQPIAVRILVAALTFAFVAAVVYGVVVVTGVRDGSRPPGSRTCPAWTDRATDLGPVCRFWRQCR